MVDVPTAPCSTLRLAGVATIENSSVDRSIVKVTVSAWVVVPLVPVIVSG
jgi:hypothetical protein